MSKFYIRWHLNPMFIPTNPDERGRLWMSLLERVKIELSSGMLKDWGICSDSSAGYALSESDEAMLHTAIQKYIPYVSFDIKPILSVDQSIESIKRSATVAKSR